MDEGEQHEGDNGYEPDAPEFEKCPSCITWPAEEQGIIMRVDGWHETINNKIKYGKAW
jgi:hypothetical protein